MEQYFTIIARIPYKFLEFHSIEISMEFAEEKGLWNSEKPSVSIVLTLSRSQVSLWNNIMRLSQRFTRIPTFSFIFADFKLPETLDMEKFSETLESLDFCSSDHQPQSDVIVEQCWAIASIIHKDSDDFL